MSTPQPPRAAASTSPGPGADAQPATEAEPSPAETGADTDPGTDALEHPPSSSRDVIPFREAVRAWFAISLQTFGGPAGQIAVMQRTLVDEKRWIGQRRFLHALSYCTLLPGPEAQQLSIYVPETIALYAALRPRGRPKPAAPRGANLQHPAELTMR